MHYAVIDAATNTVVNVIEMKPDADWEAPKGCVLIASEAAGPGDAYDPKAGEFAPAE